MALKQMVTPASNKQIKKLEDLRDRYGFKIDIPDNLSMQDASKMIDRAMKQIADVPSAVFTAFQKGYEAMFKAEPDEEKPIHAFMVIYDAPQSLAVDSPKESGLKVRNRFSREKDEYRTVSRPKLQPVLPAGVTKNQEIAFWKTVKSFLTGFAWSIEDEEGNVGFSIRQSN